MDIRSRSVGNETAFDDLLDRFEALHHGLIICFGQMVRSMASRDTTTGKSVLCLAASELWILDWGNFIGLNAEAAKTGSSNGWLGNAEKVIGGCKGMKITFLELHINEVALFKNLSVMSPCRLFAVTGTILRTKAANLLYNSSIGNDRQCFYSIL